MSGRYINFSSVSTSTNSILGTTRILAHQIAISEQNYENLCNFVRKGGTLIVDGLVAFYDEKAISKMANGCELTDLLGGSVSEFVFEKDIFDLKIDNRKLSAHALKGVIKLENEKSLSKDQREVLELLHPLGKGKVV